MLKLLNRVVIFFFCIVLMLAVTLPISAHTHGKLKTVRVGWYNSPFNMKDAQGRRSGYAYEYQRKIAAYTGWTYEYVEGSWPELMKMLINGEIDLLSDVSYTQERAKQMLFSKLSMGTEEYHIFINSDNKEILRNGYSTLNGKKAGIYQGSYQIGIFRNWEAVNGIQTKLVKIKSKKEDYIAMLKRGEIDVFVGVGRADMQCIMPIATIGSSDFFFAVNKAHPELLEELNVAMNHILHEFPNFNSQLKKKYSLVTNDNVFLPIREKSWLDSHGIIRVGYRDNYLPFCARDPKTGKLIGVLKNFINQASHCLNNAEIKFKAIPFQTTTEILEALKHGKIDCVFPMNISEHDSEQLGLLITAPVIQTEMNAIVRTDMMGEFSLNRNVVVAVNEGNPNYESFLNEHFPNWKKVYFPNTDVCLKAVAERKADCILVSSYRVNNLAEQLENYQLSYLNTSVLMDTSFVVSLQNSCLYSILNKVTNIISASSMNMALATWSYVDQPVTFASFVRHNIFLVLMVVVVILAVILFFLFRSIRSERKTREAMEHIGALNESLSSSQQNLKEALNVAKQANHAKTIFLSNMSHEIRTPMNAIIGLDNIAMKNPDITPYMRELLEKIGMSARHLLGLINDILDMSRIESGRMTLKEEEFSFHELLDQINVIINGQCVDKGLNYECKVIGKSDDYYVSDSIKLKQVLINILGNAVKFTEAPGSVTFTVEQTASSENHRILRFVIRDTGIGMSKEFISKIFEAFSQEKEGSSNEYGSTGLGMAITKNIVTMMNGDIQVESEKGVGSTFTVCVTLKSSERSAQKDNSKTLLAEQQALIDNDEQKKPTNEKLAGCRVLVVEDMEINAEILMKQLEMKEIQSEHAENGQRAVDMFSEHPAGYYDIILMDVRMPVLDGLKATRVIRGLERSDAKLIPIIAITANAFDEDVQQSMKAGMNAHLSKPIEPEHLYDILCQFVRNENENTAS